MNVKKGIIELLIFPLFIISMMPLSVHAENVGGNSPIIGVNITVTDYEYSKIPVQATVSFETDQTRWQCMSSHSTMGCQVWQSQNTNGVVQNDITGRISYTSTGTVEGYLYEYDFVLDNSYVGSVTFSSGSIGGTTATTYFVNGTHLVLTSTQLMTAFTITSYDLTVIPNNNERWDFPIESFSIISSCFNNNLEVVGFDSVNQYYFPLFKVYQNNTITQYYASTDDKFNSYDLILFVDRNIYNSAQFLNYFSISDGEITKYTAINRFRYNNRTSYIIRLTISNYTSGGTKTISYINSSESTIMPIYLGYSTYENVSLDFALLFGLSNSILDDISKIANGTTNSSSSVSSADQQNDTFKDQANDLITQEEDFTSDMKQNLQQIDTSFTFNNFGNKFMSSAVWVRDQYDHMITNTPFGTLVTFSLLLGLGLLIIGRTVNK